MAEAAAPFVVMVVRSKWSIVLSLVDGRPFGATVVHRSCSGSKLGFVVLMRVARLGCLLLGWHEVSFDLGAGFVGVIQGLASRNLN